MNSNDSLNKWNKFRNNLLQYKGLNLDEYRALIASNMQFIYGWEVVFGEKIDKSNFLYKPDIVLGNIVNPKYLVMIISQNSVPNKSDIKAMHALLYSSKNKLGMIIGKNVDIIYASAYNTAIQCGLSIHSSAIDNNVPILIDQASSSRESIVNLVRESTISSKPLELAKWISSGNGKELISEALTERLRDKYNHDDIVKALSMTDIKLLPNINATYAVHNIEYPNVDTERSSIIANTSMDQTGRSINQPVGKSSRTTFAQLGITPDSLIVFQGRGYKVLDSNNLIQGLDGEVTTTSAVVKKALGGSRNGFDYFTYNGKKLTGIRREVDPNYGTTHYKDKYL